MSDLKNSSFSFVQFQIDEFEIKRFPIEEGKPIYEFSPSGYIDNDKKIFALTIEFKIKDSNTSYVINSKCIGLFKFDSEQVEDELIINNYFFLNAPAIVFPYIRSYIASVTALSGLSAINLPLLNFSKAIGDQLKKNTTSSKIK